MADKYFYVKSGYGTRTTGGGDTSERTGAFSGMAAADVYGSIGAALADTLAADDNYLRVSHLHDHVNAVDHVYWSAAEQITRAHIMSVSDSDCAAYLVGAKEKSSNTSKYFYTGPISGQSTTAVGIDITAGDRFYISSGVCCEVVLIDCTLSSIGNGPIYSPSTDGATATLIGCTLELQFTSIGTIMAGPSGAGSITFDNCDYSLAVTNGTGNLVAANFVNGGGTVTFRACDLTHLGIGTLLTGVGSAASADDHIDVRFIDCELHAGISIYNDEEFARRNQTYLVQGTAATAAEREYQYYYATMGGTLEADTSKYRDNSIATPGGTKFSLKLESTATNASVRPLTLPLPTFYAELSNATTDTLRIYLVSTDSTLTDADIWVEVSYPTSTAPAIARSVANAHATTRAGVALDTSTEGWTGVTTETKYQIDVDTSAAAGVDCVPEITLYCSKPSLTVFVCSSVDQVA